MEPWAGAGRSSRLIGDWSFIGFEDRGESGRFRGARAASAILDHACRSGFFVVASFCGKPVSTFPHDASGGGGTLNSR
jgi:hypothetical protein